MSSCFRTISDLRPVRAKLVSKWLLTAAFSFCFANASAQTRCDVLVNPVIFGPYNPLNTSDLENSSGSVEVVCRASAPVTISFSVALSSGSSSGFNPRTLRQVTRPNMMSLNYNLFTTPSRQTIWGDGNSYPRVTGSVVVAAANSNFTSGLVPIYAVLFAQQLGRDGGAYGDNVRVTVSY
jgi:spore coat protein U-like protein